jgi:plasmid stabilization system protein ParE
MPQFAVEVHSLEADDGEGVERRHCERNETAASRLRRELDRAVDVISEGPQAGSPHLRSTWRMLRRFTFFVVDRGCSVRLNYRLSASRKR